MKPIPFSQHFDKLDEPIHTTIRSMFSYQKGRPPLDKSISYYKTGEHYMEMLQNKPFQEVRLFGLEVNVKGSSIPEQFLLKDVQIVGKPDMAWYKKIREMDHALILHLKVVSKNISL